jgi:TonB family protein
MNMVAHEVPLRVMGTHENKGAGGPELFVEDANSVLVYENGGVVLLSKVVVPGQLLLLANLESKREVVAQVKRRRGHNATSCYVELEFAEPAPRFWGLEFSAATALLPKKAKDAEAAALVRSAQVIDEPAEPLAAPAAGEVQALRRQVEALMAKAVGAAAGAQSPSPEHDLATTQLAATEQAVLPKLFPGSTMSPPKPKVRIRARGNFTPAFRGGILRLALLTTALAITILGAAWYKHWNSARNKSWMRVAAVGANAKTSLPPGGPEVAKEHPESTNTIKPGTPSQGPGSLSQPVASNGAVGQRTVKKTSPAATLVGKEKVVRPTSKGIAQPVLASPVQSVVVPPKLIKSVRAVVSLDDVRDFETGNVVIDAVVGTEGEVHFISVISGPPSLRSAAIEAVKQYRYEPAMRNGQPVPEHVNITIRFKFES